MFLIGKQKHQKMKTQVMEFNYAKEGEILQEINKIVFKTKELTEATKSVSDILSEYYDLDYCTMFLYSAGKMSISATNVDRTYISDMEQEINEIYHEKIAGSDEEIDAYIIKSRTGLQYRTAPERDIKHMIFIPMIVDEVLGGILIENKSEKLEKLEYEFFQVVVDNISVIVQNLIYFKQIIDSANLDGLTSIYNRYYLNNHLNKQIEIFSKKTGAFSIAMFDIDFFKKFNDTYGHIHGDKVLRSVAQCAKDNVREIDTVYRYGGEEFIIYMPNFDSEEAYIFVDEVRKRIESMNVYTDDGKLTKVTASFGVAEFPKDNITMEGLIECADKALYTAKESGRNNVQVYRF